MNFINRSWLWLVPILLLMMWLGARRLNADAIWHDEYWSLFNAGGAQYGPLTPGQIWERISRYDAPQAPGYYLLLGGWGNLVGWTPFATRSLSLLFGVLAAAWAYRLGRDMASPRAGLYAAAVLATSAFFVHYLHEMRVYALYVLVTLIVMWAYWRIVRTKQAPGLAVQATFFVGVLASLYLHYLMGLTLVAIAAYHLLFVPKNRDWWRVVILMGAASLLFLPWLPVFVNGMGIKTTVTGSATPLQSVRNLAFALSNGSVLLLVVVVGLALLARGQGAGFVGFVFAAMFLLGIALNVGVLIRSDTRYFTALWALFPVMAGVALAQLPKMRFRPELVLGVWMLTGVTASLTRDFVAGVIGVGLFDSVFPWDVAAEALTPYAQPGDLATFTLPDGLTTWLQWEANGHYMFDLETNRGVRRWIVANDTGYAAALTLEDEPFERVWTAYMQPKPALLTEFEGVLAEDYIPCGNVANEGAVSLDLYARCAVCCPPEAGAALYQFGEGIAISGIEPLPEEISETLDVRLGWMLTDSVPRYTYSVALHVVGEAGQLVAQMDYGLPEQRFSCAPVTVGLADVPAGEFQLFAVVYAWETGERLAGTTVATGETGERVALGTFRIGEAAGAKT